MSRSDTAETDPEWWCLIDKKAALREQFPSIAKVRSERPGSATDAERKRLYREAAELSKAREQQRRWNAAVEANATRQRVLAQRRENAEYRARNQQRHERRTA